MTKKLLVVGLDGASWDYIEPLLTAGSMPTLQNLMERGSSGNLSSTIPPITPVAWASLATGKNPGKHGIFGWRWRRPGTWEFLPFSGSQMLGTPFWRYMNRAGVKVGLANIPMTYPLPQEMDGFAICGFGAPSSAYPLTYPSDLHDELSRNFGWRVNRDPERYGTGELSDNDYYVKEREIQEQDVKAALYSAAKYDVDVLAINLMLMDHCNHKVREFAIVEEALRECDRHLAMLMEKFHAESTVVISDHGSRRVSGTFLLGLWLRDRGYLNWKTRSELREDDVNWLLVCLLQNHLGWSGLLEKVVRVLLSRALWRMGEGIRSRFFNLAGKIAPAVWDVYRFSEQPDLKESLVYPGDWGAIYANVRGQTPQGRVDPEALDSLVDELRIGLESICDPESDDRVFGRIEAPSSVYQGGLTPQAPDLILDCTDSMWGVKRGLPTGYHHFGRYFEPASEWHGDHSRDGILVVAGAHFKSSVQQLGASLIDIPPTLLHSLGIPIPEDWDGLPLLELLRGVPTRADQIPRQSGDSSDTRTAEKSRDADEWNEVEERLAALGYLE